MRAERELVEGGWDEGIRENSCRVQEIGEPGSGYRKPSGGLTLTLLPPVVSWIDVYARATCQPREVVVPLTVELMGTVAKQLVPSCVTVQRCGGCCPDDGLECVPTGQHQVRMQVLGPVGRAQLGRMLGLRGVVVGGMAGALAGQAVPPAHGALPSSVPLMISHTVCPLSLEYRYS